MDAPHESAHPIDIHLPGGRDAEVSQIRHRLYCNLPAPCGAVRRGSRPRDHHRHHNGQLGRGRPRRQCHPAPSGYRLIANNHLRSRGRFQSSLPFCREIHPHGGDAGFSKGRGGRCEGECKHDYPDGYSTAGRCGVGNRGSPGGSDVAADRPERHRQGGRQPGDPEVAVVHRRRPEEQPLFRRPQSGRADESDQRPRHYHRQPDNSGRPPGRRQHAGRRRRIDERAPQRPCHARRQRRGHRGIQGAEWGLLRGIRPLLERHPELHHQIRDQPAPRLVPGAASQ